MIAGQELGDEPIQEKYLNAMIRLADMIDTIFNGNKRGADRETGFVLLVFPFGDEPGRANYISNGADRKEIVQLFKEQIKRFEGTYGQK